ncbi:methyl-accepting chemotaxis protein [Halomonas faecis]|uniref:methyl-accepting chemotaxis protein n=1 Tax=Halomonas faecis TaxID=1562110 RepID=UPI0013D0BF62|nr:methyl-accepting chemotaxis protein [Halomonas faecis]
MKHLSIKWSLTAALAVLVLMIGLISGLSFYSSSTSQRALHELEKTNIQLANQANRAQVNVLRAQTHLDRYASLSTQGNSEKGRENQELAKEALAAARERFAAFREVDVAPDDPRAPYVAAIDEAFEAYVNDGLEPLLDETPFRIMRSQEELAELGIALDTAMREFIDDSESHGRTVIDEVTGVSRIIGIIDVTLLVAALLAVLVIRYGMMRVVVTPLRRAVDHFERIAGGDLTERIEDRGRNEIGQLYRGLASMQDKLKGLVVSLRDSSDNVFTGAGEIASGSQDLSSRTEQQASALQQTASSMEEMASTVRTNSETAQEADKLATSASQTAEAGGQEVERTVQVMREIAASANRVNEIIGVIDSIAFQTNILALNASVEAARAGEHGRGFAVVAEEVRKLASRSAESAKEIRGLIEATTSQVTSGAEQAERSGTTIGETVESIRQVTALMSEISTATREQNGGIEQINSALTEMDSVTQQNASLVQQTSAAAASLEEQAKHLAGLIATFRIDDREAPAAQPAARLTHRPSDSSSHQDDHASASREVDPKPQPRHKKPAEDVEEWTEF